MISQWSAALLYTRHTYYGACLLWRCYDAVSKTGFTYGRPCLHFVWAVVSSRDARALMSKHNRDALGGHTMSGSLLENERQDFILCRETERAIDFRRLGDVLRRNEPGQARWPVN